MFLGDERERPGVLWRSVGTSQSDPHFGEFGKEAFPQSPLPSSGGPLSTGPQVAHPPSGGKPLAAFPTLSPWRAGRSIFKLLQ